jgi:hypothetical protein
MSKGGRPSHITEADKAEIRRRYGVHLANSMKSIALDYKVSRVRIWQIINNVGPRNANPSPRTTTQEGNPQPLAKGP